MIAFERRIKFEEVDAANIVFFARFVTYAHEAMEHFFDQLDGGYSGCILQRRIGFPAVHVEMDFKKPVRYGDTLRIETSVTRLGNRSATFRYRMVRADDGTLSAEVRHTVVVTDLGSLKSCEMPEDVREVLFRNLQSS